MREYAADWEALKRTDPEVANAVAGELNRERTNLRLIASENYASPAVLAAVGSTLSDKYAEGYPGRRYYGGCRYVDVVEQLVQHLLAVAERAFEVRVVAAPAHVLPAHRPERGGCRAVVLERRVHVLVEVLAR